MEIENIQTLQETIKTDSFEYIKEANYVGKRKLTLEIYLILYSPRIFAFRNGGSRSPPLRNPDRDLLF